MLNIVIPMAGEGSRFKKAGYTVPKPFIPIGGVPMIRHVIRNVTPVESHKFILIARHEHREYLDKVIKTIPSPVEIVWLSEPTEGAACTVLKASQHFEKFSPLLIVNSDQLVRWNEGRKVTKVNHNSSPEGLFFKEQNDVQDLINDCRQKGASCSIATFNADNPKWSYARVERNQFGVEIVKEVAEKKVISNQATVGVYYWGSATWFVNCAEEMIENNERVNNEFYVCPVFNVHIRRTVFSPIITYPVAEMIGLGTPEDFEHYLRTRE